MLHLVTYRVREGKGKESLQVFELLRIGVVRSGSFETWLRLRTHQKVMSHQQ